MVEAIWDCVPRDKHDLARAERAVAVGWPGVRPIVPALLEWVQDINWPVACLVLAPFLASLGGRIEEEVRVVLATDDVWKYWVISEVVGKWPREEIEPLAPVLVRIATRPTKGEKFEEVDLVAKEVLAYIGGDDHD
ncbi:MAG TPA: DUF5071 domain-containing protein [Anaerolineae bacterium]|nr:DUF5071 domain-containing protein [Anaerolineae bacterium]